MMDRYNEEYYIVGRLSKGALLPISGVNLYDILAAQEEWGNDVCSGM